MSFGLIIVGLLLCAQPGAHSQSGHQLHESIRSRFPIRDSIIEGVDYLSESTSIVLLAQDSVRLLNGNTDIAVVALTSGGNTVLLAVLEHGGGTAEIADLASVDIDCDTHNELIVISRRYVNHRGLGTIGDWYMPYVFDDETVRDDKACEKAIPITDLMKRTGEGMKGMLEGEPVNYPFTTVGAVVDTLMADSGSCFARLNRISDAHREAMQLYRAGKLQRAINSLSIVLEDLDDIEALLAVHTDTLVRVVNDYAFFKYEYYRQNLKGSAEESKTRDRDPGGMAVGLLRESLRLLEMVIHHAPERKVAYLNVGDVCWEVADFPGAVSAYKKYVSLLNGDGRADMIPKRVHQRIEMREKD